MSQELGTIEEIIDEVKRYFSLDDEVKINRQTKLEGIIDSEGNSLFSEPAELLGVCYRLGLSLQSYSSGEKLNDKGLEMLNYAVLKENIILDVQDLAEKIEKSKIGNGGLIITTSEVIKSLTPGYLLRMKEYDLNNRVKTKISEPIKSSV